MSKKERENIKYEMDLALCNYDEYMLWENQNSKIEQLQSDNERLQRELNALRPNPDHDAAMAAGDGTLHGAIDYWQGESDRLQKRVSKLEEAIEKCIDHLMAAGGRNISYSRVKKLKQALGESNE